MLVRSPIERWKWNCCEMPKLHQTDILIIGRGLAGTALAWTCWQQERRFVLLGSDRRAAASAVAAGLIMPISGRRAVMDPNFPAQMRHAEDFYRNVERILKQPLFRRISVYRRFLNDSEREKFQQETDPAICESIQLTADGSGLVMQGARLDVPRFLSSSERWFREQSASREFLLQSSTELQFSESGVLLRQESLEAQQVVFCTGAHMPVEDLFPKVPDHPVQGEILHLRISTPPHQNTVGTHWLTPAPSMSGNAPDSDYLVGATYNRVQPGRGPTPEGCRELLQAAAELSGQAVSQDQVARHDWGIRPAMKNRQLLIKRHRLYSQAAIISGLGSRGTLLAPAAAAQVLELLAQPVPDSSENAVRKVISLTPKAHSAVRRRYREGDWLIDATAGNGHDTLFLARLGGPDRVVAIDIQQQALLQTEQRLREHDQQGVSLHCGDHARKLHDLIAETPQIRPGAVMFNLGYLPRSDHNVITRPESTIPALQAAVSLLREGGVLTVTAYRGHAGGPEEAQAVRRFFAECSDGQVSELPGNTEDVSSPLLFIFQKKNHIATRTV